MTLKKGLNSWSLSVIEPVKRKDRELKN
ncbi:hypothetical protein Gohar_008481 [Gossypium harknessii]|uniref:Uncharacterized protein n=1 Tax=Gossypium harknessii TaxID=34285 RepID=A0A7J9GJZ9_9ROSI|nr:hypothetical protein [Gossypium harknessii]